MIKYTCGDYWRESQNEKIIRNSNKVEMLGSKLLAFSTFYFLWKSQVPLIYFLFSSPNCWHLSSTVISSLVCPCESMSFIFFCCYFRRKHKKGKHVHIPCLMGRFRSSKISHFLGHGCFHVCIFHSVKCFYKM